MIVIADAGSTKVDWRAVNDFGSVKGLTTPGINPVFLSAEEIYEIIHTKLETLPVEEVIRVWYYGAGVLSDETKSTVCTALSRVFPAAKCHAGSDMEAAARSLCGRSAGIACILGTGSNSCFWDGTSIAANVYSGGFILGDEASGAYFGRRLLADFVKGLLPVPVKEELVRRFSLDYPTVVKNVYKEPMPSRYLASFAPFIREFRNHPHITQILRSGFDEFLRRNVSGYDTRSNPVNFTGSVAFYFKEELQKSLAAAGMREGRIVRTPMDGLIAYHRED